VSLSRKTFSSSLWHTSAAVVEKIISLSVYVLVARQIGVEEFGHVVFCFLVLEFYNFMAGFGVKENIIRTKSLSDTFINTSFWIMFLIGGLLSTVTYFAIAPIVQSYSPGPMSEILKTLSLIPILSAINTVFVGVLQRDFDYKKLAFRGVISSGMSGLVGVSLAFNEFGAYALVGARYTYVLLNLLILFILTRLKISLTFNIKEAKSIFRFGLPIMLSQAVSFLGGKSMEIIAVSALGSVALGLIDVGKKFITTIYQMFLTPMNAVSLSYFSRVEEKFDAFTKIVTVVSFILIPLIFTIGFYAEELTFLFFGSGWLKSSLVTKLLAFGVLASCSGWFINNLLISLNEVKLVLYFNIFTLCLNIMTALIAVNFGLYVYILSLVVLLSFTEGVKLWVLKVKYGFNLLQFILQIIKPLTAAGFMVFAYYISSLALSSAEAIGQSMFGLLCYLFLNALLGLFIYGSFCYVLFRREIVFFVSELKV